MKKEEFFSAPTLAFLDPFYGMSSDGMSVEEKIRYCEQLIELATGRLSLIDSPASDSLKEHLNNLIRAAKAEITLIDGKLKPGSSLTDQEI